MSGFDTFFGIKINSKIENIELVKKFIENGLLSVPAGENVIRILPPLIITSENVAEAKKIMEKSFS